jgi:hypothetical protein
MRDKRQAKKSSRENGNLASITNNFPSPPFIRAMANTLYDHNVDMLHQFDMAEVMRALISAGWPTKLIAVNIEAALLMATIRQRNEEQRQKSKPIY